MPFSPGDIVQLKSGGPAMTVASEGSDGVHGIWHASSVGDLKSSVIPAACLDTLDLDDFDIEDLEDADDEDSGAESDDEEEATGQPK